MKGTIKKITAYMLLSVFIIGNILQFNPNAILYTSALESDVEETIEPASGEWENITWELTEDGTLVISGSGDMPEEYYKYNIPWDRFRDDIYKVIINDGVTSIGKYAFDDCRNLISIIIPDGVTNIENYAFFNCENLTSIMLPDSITSIGENAFCHCSSLTSITIPDGVTVLETGVFSSCESLKNIIIPDGVTNIGDSAFYQCSNLTNIKIPNSVTSIGEHTFSQCSSLTNIIIPDCVTSIGYSAFSRCTSLTNIFIPNSVTSIGAYAFALCENLTNISIPDDVTSIEDYTFGYCGSLTNVTIPDGVTSIGEQAFFVCQSLKSITLPSSITSIGEYAFNGCSRLTDVYYTGSEEQWNRISILDSSSFDGVTIHYNSEGETGDSEKTFSLSKSKAWIAGKECILSGTYVASVPGSVISELSGIIWNSSDSSIINISEVENEYSLADVDNNKATIMKSYIAKKVGTVTITAVTPDGRNANITIDVEPELVAVGTDGKLKEETEVVLYEAKLDKPDAEYLENFISKIDVNISDDALGAAVMKDKHYIVSDDGLSAQIIATIEPIYDGTIKIRAISAGGQEVYEEIRTDTDNLRPGEIGNLWTNSDEWSFTNSATEDAFGTNVEEGYYITQEDYDRLISQLSNTSKDLITFSTNMASGTTQGVNIYRYNINGSFSNAHKTWGGSCYGMSTWACLVKSGVLNTNAIYSDTARLKDYLCDQRVESAINYYHMQQHLPSVQNEKNRYMNEPSEVRLHNLVELCSGFNRNNKPVLISFGWYSDFNSDGSPKEDSSIGHAVVGYGVEDVEPIQIEVLNTSFKYNHRILIYDCAKNSDTYIYYNDEGYWCYPEWNIVSDPVKTDNEIYDNTNNGTLSFAITDTNIMNSIDYRTGDTLTVNQEDLSVKNSDTPIILTTDANTSYSIQSPEYSADINGFMISNYSGKGQINVSIAPNITTEGEIQETTASAYLPESEYYIITTDKDMIGYQLYAGNYLSNVYANSSGNVKFGNNGKVELLADESTTYNISLTANEGYYNLPWYRIQLSGDNAKEIVTEMTDEGILVTGDNLENITIVTSNDNESQNITFSTDEDSVLISESDDKLIALEDTDNDGVYDTEVNEKENHNHQYNAPVFEWSEDMTLCTAIFTCKDSDDQQKISCTIESFTNEDNQLVYKATVEFGGISYTDSQVVKTGENPDDSNTDNDNENDNSNTGTSSGTNDVSKPGDINTTNSNHKIDKNNAVETGDNNFSLQFVGLLTLSVSIFIIMKKRYLKKLLNK